MHALSTLPPELLLLISEHAAASEAWRRLGWTASLCRVCKSLHRAVTPILYAHMVVTEHNIHLLVQLASGSSGVLAHVRSATFSGSFRTSQDRDRQSIISAMPHLRALTGFGSMLGMLLDGINDLCLSSIFVTDVTGSLSYELPGLKRYIQMATRLHILVPLRTYPIGIPQDVKTEYLILDVLVDGPEDESTRSSSLYTDFLRQVEGTLNSIDSLRRILIRTRARSSVDMAPFHIAIEKWAEEKRDHRIWIDTSASAPWLDPTVFEAANMKDAAAGDELWFEGRQIYSQP